MKLLKTLLVAGIAVLISVNAVAAAETLKLGHITVRSGPLKGPGEPSIAAVDLAVAEINLKGGVNGKLLEIIRFDSASDPKQAALGARKLAKDDGVIAILGPFSSGEAAVAFNVAEREKIVMMSNASSAPGLTDGKEWAWRLTEDEGKQFARLLTTLQELDVPRQKAEIVYVSDERVANIVGTKLYPALMSKFGISHGEPVAITHENFDLAPQIAPVVEAKPDLVAVAGLPENAAKTIRELKRQGFEGTMIGSQLFSDPNIMELFGDLAEGTTFVAGFHRDSSPAAREFNISFIAENKARGIRKLGAHHTDAQSYDAMHLFAQVMEEQGITGDPDKLAAERLAFRNGLKTVKFSGILGNDLCFDGTDAELPGYVITIKNGKWTLLATHAADSCG